MDVIFPKVLQAVATEDHCVLAYMNDGTIRRYDAKPIIEKGGVFEPLRDWNTFAKSLTVLNDTIAWDLSGKRDPSDCLDIDPFTIQAQPIASDNMTA